MWESVCTHSMWLGAHHLIDGGTAAYSSALLGTSTKPKPRSLHFPFLFYKLLSPDSQKNKGKKVIILMGIFSLNFSNLLPIRREIFFRLRLTSRWNHPESISPHLHLLRLVKRAITSSRCNQFFLSLSRNRRHHHHRRRRVLLSNLFSLTLFPARPEQGRALHALIIKQFGRSKHAIDRKCIFRVKKLRNSKLRSFVIE